MALDALHRIQKINILSRELARVATWLCARRASATRVANNSYRMIYKRYSIYL